MSSRASTPGRAEYYAIAEELSAPGVKLSDLDEESVELARAYAKRNHKKWPPRPQVTGWQVHIQGVER
jgi:hypothetical protein